MTRDKPIHNIDGSIITPAEARRTLKEYKLLLKRAKKAREEAAQAETLLSEESQQKPPELKE